MDMNANFTERTEVIALKNQYEILGDHTLVHMRCGKACTISTSTLDIVKPYNWCVEGTGYVMSRSGGKPIKMHRLILSAPKGIYVDHIDGNPLNNTIENLRMCRKQQNEFNTKIRMDNSSGYKGVSFSKSKRLYRAYINRDGKQYFLGYFLTKEEAAVAYNEAAVVLFGEFARLNQILNPDLVSVSAQ